MNRVKVTRSFQVTIPREVREVLGIRVGDYLNVYVDERGR
ncbi:MAG: AbrB/MazE/SpoVT family DNA-binding domain-containing protein, partial [Thermofilaceae archaeon]